MKKSKIVTGYFVGVYFSLGCVFASLGGEYSQNRRHRPDELYPGKGHWNGAVMAAEELNAKGGIQVGKKKMKVELVKADSNEFLNITDATNAMERVITYDKADFIVGGFRTEAGLSMQDIAMDYKKIFLGCGAATKVICDRVEQDYERYKLWFRITPISNPVSGRQNRLQHSSGHRNRHHQKRTGYRKTPGGYRRGKTGLG